MAATTHTELFNCSISDFFKIVTDYERYPEYLQEVKACHVLKTEGNKKLVEYKVSLIKNFTYTLWMSEKEPTSLTWEFAGGDVFKSNNGSWKLEDEAGKCRALYSVEATFSLFVPGPVAKTLLTVNLPTMMSAYHRRVKEVYGR